MDTSLNWIAVGIGAAAALLGVVAGRRRDAPRQRAGGDWIVATAALITAIVVYLLTRPENPPFAMGQRLGYGALIGGLCGGLAGLWSSRAAGASLWGSGIAMAGLSSLSLIGASLTLVIFPGYPQPALAGFMIGAVIASVLFRLTIPAAKATEAWCLSSVILASAILLAVFRYDATAERFWWRAPLLIFASVIAAQILAATTAREGKSFALPAIVASAITLALTAVFAWRLFPDWYLLWAAATGIVTFGVVAWLAAVVPHSARSAAAVALATVAFATLAFRLLAGFGIAIGLLAGWSVLLPALAARLRAQPDEEPGTEPAQILTYAAFIGAGVLLFRLFLENYSKDIGALDLRMHNTLLALALGAVFPFVLTSFFPIPARRGVGWRLSGAGVAGILSAALPLLVLIIWGFKPTLGFLAGCIAAEVFILFACTSAVRMIEQGYLESALLVLTAQVSAVLLSGLLAPLIETTRATKAIILAAVVVVGLILAVVFGLIARVAPREE